MKKNVKLFLKMLLIIFWVGGGINHFINTEFYINLMPGWLPMHRELVLLSGVTEIIAGLMVAVPALTRYGVWFIYAHLAIFMVVHVHMIVNASTQYADIPIATLWIRIPVQGLFALWAWWCTKPESDDRPGNMDAPAAA